MASHPEIRHPNSVVAINLYTKESSSDVEKKVSKKPN